MAFGQLLGAFDIDMTDNSTECSASAFIQAALKTGRYVDKDVRQSILRDISDILECRPKDLSFLFEATNDDADDPLLVVPSRKSLLEVAANDTAILHEAAE